MWVGDSAVQYGNLGCTKSRIIFAGVFLKMVKFPITQLQGVLLIGGGVISLVGESEKWENRRISWSPCAMQIKVLCCLMLPTQRLLL